MDATAAERIFADLRWHRLRLELLSRKYQSVLKGHPISVVEAILKAVTDSAWGLDSSRSERRPFFHLKGKANTYKMIPLDKIQVEVLFAGRTFNEIAVWRDCLLEYMDREDHSRTYELLSLEEIEERSYSALFAEKYDIPSSGEICLEFLTPMFFKPQQGKTRTFIDKTSFALSFGRRFSRLFDKEIVFDAAHEAFFLLPYYWNYTEIHHSSGTQPGQLQYINGCAGPLFLKGEWSGFIPFLILGSELHTGSKLSNSQGYYRILPESRPFFDFRFPDPKSIEAACQDVLDRYDEALFSLSREAKETFKREKFAAEIYQEIRSGEYAPAPHTAFIIKGDRRQERLVEQPSYRDLIVGQYLLKTIGPIFDRFFEEESIGFRRGLSRDKAVELAQKAMAEGCEWVIESDVEDFFPSIDLEKLSSLLDRYLPSKDGHLKNTLHSVIFNGYLLGGRLRERTKGLALGHPLSPLLANLYLDAFDENVKELGFRFVRYGDDFLIFCRSQGDAERALAEAESFLETLRLKLKKDKTAIHKASEGFEFLGLSFAGPRGETAGDSELKLLKKPLYITEPFLFLSLNGETVEIKRDRQIIESVPLRRLGEIMVMEKTAFSSSLLRKCVETSIPFTITLDTGYFITTIKPDSKAYYLMSSIHAERYGRLSQGEALEIAKGFARGKLSNYRTLFLQKYKSGMNQILHELSAAERSIEASASLDEIRGLEGHAAKRVFEFLNALIDNPAFHIEKRIRRPPDRINSLLNFGYYLLFSRINAALRAAGLNPYLGFLHSPQDDYESLASDIVDLFRARMDRFLVKLINLKTITESDFVEREGGYYLQKEGRRKFLSHLEAEMNHRVKRDVLSLKEEIHLQVLALKKWAGEGGSIVFYRWQR